MPPQGEGSYVLYETDATTEDKAIATVTPSADKRKHQFVWRNIILIGAIHIAAVYGAYLFLTRAKWSTLLFTFLLANTSGLGVTAGAHRLWTHKTYKARWPLRLLLIIFNTVAFQDAILHWARDHRMHHKYSETDADPHNATKGFFFSHVGWLLVRKHPQIKAMAHTIDMSDLKADPMLRFQDKYYLILMPLACFILPTYIPTLWGESLYTAFYVCAVFRYVFVLNATWLVNSAAHMFGNKPYDKNIGPVENMTVAALALGEGFHNYHHTFPWDYKTGELDGSNTTKVFIDWMAKIGWAYDMKTVSQEVIESRVKRTGDGSHPVWGWDDQDVSAEEKKAAIIIHPELIEDTKQK